MGEVKGICISKIRGIQKHEVAEATLKENWGIEGDAHAGDWQRQISLLDYAEIEHVRSNGTDADFGTFGENLIVEGYDLKQLPLGTRLRIGEDAGQANKGPAGRLRRGLDEVSSNHAHATPRRERKNAREGLSPSHPRLRA